MKTMLVLAHVVTLLTLPFVLVGVINRTKALWAGRRGQPIPIASGKVGRAAEALDAPGGEVHR